MPDECRYHHGEEARYCQACVAHTVDARLRGNAILIEELADDLRSIVTKAQWGA